MNTIRVPKIITEKTRYIKAFIKSLRQQGDSAILEGIDEVEAIKAAEYYYEKGKLDALEAALSYSKTVALCQPRP